MQKLLLSLYGLLLAGNSTFAENIHINFRKVETFRNPALVVSYQLRLMYMDVSRDSQFRHGTFLNKSIIPICQIAVLPDGSRFYVGTETGLSEFDGAANLLRSIPIGEFNLGLGNWYFYFDTKASNDTLWLTAVHKEGNGPNSINTCSIVQWKPSDPPEKRLVAPWAAISIVVDKMKNRVIIPSLKPEYYDLAPELLRGYRLGDFPFADYDEKWGILLSRDDPERETEIIKVDFLNKSDKVFLPKGTFGLWGSDGYIYFCRGTTQLWRCKPDGNHCEPVYLADGVKTERKFITKPQISQNRKYLAFSYGVPRLFRTDLVGTILLDLDNKEYRELPGVWFRTLAWVVGDKKAGKKPIPSSMATIKPSMGRKSSVPVTSSQLLDLTPLHRAIKEGNMSQTRQLICQGANVNAKDHNGFSPFHLEVMRLMEISKKPNNDKVWSAEKVIFDMMLARGADINTQRIGRMTPLDDAIQMNNKKVAELLVASGAKINLPTDGGVTPLFFAVSQKTDKKLIELLINKGADVNGKGGTGKSILHMAVYFYQPDKDIVEMLLAKGADPNVRDNQGRTPLHDAVKMGAENILKVLIDKGAKVDAQDQTGSTPLHEAICVNREPIVHVLISKGANIMIKNREGYTPEQLATNFGLTNLSNLLKGHNQ